MNTPFEVQVEFIQCRLVDKSKRWHYHCGKTAHDTVNAGGLLKSWQLIGNTNFLQCHCSVQWLWVNDLLESRCTELATKLVLDVLHWRMPRVLYLKRAWSYMWNSKEIHAPKRLKDTDSDILFWKYYLKPKENCP